MSEKKSYKLFLENFDQELYKKKLDQLNHQIESLLSDKSNFDGKQYAQLAKDRDKIVDILDLFTKLQKNISEIEENQWLLSDESIHQFASEEITRLEIETEDIIEKVEGLIIEPIQNDDKNAIIEIRPGVGGVEASLFAETLFNMYTKHLSSQNTTFQIYSIDYNNEGGINSAIFEVSEINSFGYFRFESGVHRVQRVPTTESSGRIHTSTASVVVLPKFESSEVKINQNDIRIDVYRSGGPGGQSVNTTDSAVRITHLPSNIVVTCQNSKSQHKNKELALSLLYSKLAQIEEDKKASSEKNLRQNAISGGDRSMKIRTYNFPQSRVTDHRVNISWFNINEIILGDIAEMISTVSKKIRQGKVEVNLLED